MATQSMPMVSCLFISWATTQLGAHAVGAGDQHRLLVTEGSEIEQAAEAADAADHARTVGARHVGLDALDDFVTGLNAYAGFLICFWHI